MTKSRPVLVVLLAIVGAWAGHSPAHALTTMEWLQAPISGAPQHEIASSVIWHGRLMAIVWAVLTPSAILIARYFKITPNQRWPERLDNPFWFLTHRRLGYLVTLLTLVGMAIIFVAGSGEWAPTRSLHTSLGWLLVVVSVCHLAGTLARGTHGGPMNPFTRQRRPPEQWPGDHFSMTRRRVLFEYSHKTVGYLMVLTAVTAIGAGLKAADAPVWMFLAISAWGLLCVALFVGLQRTVGCIDTYQAIWGLDRSLPGYRRPPIGFGVTRYSEAEARKAPWQSGRMGGDPR